MPKYQKATETVWRNCQPQQGRVVAHYLSPDDARIPHYPATGCEVIFEEEQTDDHS